MGQLMMRLVMVFLFALVLFLRAAEPIAGPSSGPKVPPPGITIPEEDRAALAAGVKAFGDEIEALRVALREKPSLLELLPDAQVFHKAVDWAVRYGEFYRTNEAQIALQLLEQGRERAKALR